MPCYMKYIATRPRAERLGGHGLFGDEDGVDLDKTIAKAVQVDRSTVRRYYDEIRKEQGATLR